MVCHEDVVHVRLAQEELLAQHALHGEAARPVESASAHELAADPAALVCRVDGQAVHLQRMGVRRQRSRLVQPDVAADDAVLLDDEYVGQGLDVEQRVVGGP